MSELLAPDEIEALRQRAVNHPVMQMMIRAMTQADERFGERLKEAMLENDPDKRVEPFLDALDAELETTIEEARLAEQERAAKERAEAVQAAYEDAAEKAHGKVMWVLKGVEGRENVAARVKERVLARAQAIRGLL